MACDVLFLYCLADESFAWTSPGGTPSTVLMDNRIVARPCSGWAAFFAFSSSSAARTSSVCRAAESEAGTVASSAARIANRIFNPKKSLTDGLNNQYIF